MGFLIKLRYLAGEQQLTVTRNLQSETEGEKTVKNLKCQDPTSEIWL